MLICIMCNKIIVMNNNPVHYGVCSSCDTTKLTEQQKEMIKKS